MPAFHRHCFLALYIPPDDIDATLTFGYLIGIWEWKRYLEILATIREKHEFPVLSDEASTYVKSMQMEALRKKYGFPSFLNEVLKTFASVSDTQIQALSEQYGIQPLPDDVSVYLSHSHMVALREAYGFPCLPNEESVYVEDVQMADVPLEALQHFKQHMQKIQPFALHTPNWTTSGRDGMLARGIVTDRDHTHRFDIWTAEHELTDRHRAFFNACISLGATCFEAGVQEHMKEIQRYLLE